MKFSFKAPVLGDISACLSIMKIFLFSLLLITMFTKGFCAPTAEKCFIESFNHTLSANKLTVKWNFQNSTQMTSHCSFQLIALKLTRNFCDDSDCVEQAMTNFLNLKFTFATSIDCFSSYSLSVDGVEHKVEIEVGLCGNAEGKIRNKRQTKAKGYGKTQS
jgi:hypothetical protein